MSGLCAHCGSPNCVAICNAGKDFGWKEMYERAAKLNSDLSEAMYQLGDHAYAERVFEKADNLDATRSWKARVSAELLLHALLTTEWGEHHLETIDEHWLGSCRACCLHSNEGHWEDCVVDRALTKAGLDTQEKRDAARKELGL